MTETIKALISGLTEDFAELYLDLSEIKPEQMDAQLGAELCMLRDKIRHGVSVLKKKKESVK